MDRIKLVFYKLRRNALIFMAIFGPATITAMADNDAAGVATYSIAGAKLGYPILFILIIITVLLAITQEMGMRVTLITRKGLADLIREYHGVKTSMLVFAGLFIGNIASVIVDLVAMKTVAVMFHFPVLPFIMATLAIVIVFVLKGNYKMTQNIMLISSLFFLAYILSAVRAQPDWNLALSNLLYPHGVAFSGEYWKNYIVIGLGVLGTTITPWGQFFISSFAYDKKIDQSKLIFSQLETYWGAFITDFFSFFMIVATAATLFIHSIPLVSGEQAALAIKPFAGSLASTLFALGIFNAGFMGIVVISLSTAYAFSEFFGLSGSLDSSFTKSKTFYWVFLIQLAIAALVLFFPSSTLFTLAVASQIINAMLLPLVFYYLIKFADNKLLMGTNTNTAFQSRFTKIASGIIVIASLFTVLSIFIKW